jgi:HPt (histidine-containing phosphotransfer) domain-containing protein
METTLASIPAPAYDPRALDAFTGGDPGIAREIYVDFIKLGKVDLDAARAALSGRDATALARAAHRIKGSARMIGAMPASEAASAVESAAREGDWAAADAGMPVFEQSLGELFSVLEAAYPASAS